MHGCANISRILTSPQLWTPLDALEVFCALSVQCQRLQWHALLFSSCFTDLSIIMQGDGVCEHSTALKQTTRPPQFSTRPLFSVNLPDFLSVLAAARLVCHSQKLSPWFHLLIRPIDPSVCFLGLRHRGRRGNERPFCVRNAMMALAYLLSPSTRLETKCHYLICPRQLGQQNLNCWRNTINQRTSVSLANIHSG